MVAHHLERRGYILEEPGAAMLDARRLAVHHPSGANHPPAVRLANGLMPETDAQYGNLPTPPSDERHGDPCFAGCTRTRREHDRRGRDRANLLDAERVIAPDDGLAAELAQILDEVVGEGIVVVDYQQHGLSPGSPAGVKLLVHRTQILAVHVRVDLRGGDIRMTQHFLHRAQIGTGFEQVRGEAVAQGMWRHMSRYTGQRNVIARCFPSPRSS